MPSDHTALAVHSNSREIANMLIGTGQLVKQCRLTTILIACQCKCQRCSIRKRMLSLLLMIFAAFTKTGMIRKAPALLQSSIFSRLRGFMFGSCLLNFFNLYLLSICQSQRQLIAVKPQFHWVSHRCILHKCYFHARNHAHIQKMLTQGTASADSQNHGRFACL